MCEFPVVREKVKHALEGLYQNDLALIEIDANERSITHWLAVYLEHQFSDSELNVDCEYNRKSKLPKRLEFSTEQVSVHDTNARTVYPDVVIHTRGQKRNLLVVEVKKATNTDSPKRDLEKLIDFGGDSDYQYRYGVYISLNARGVLLQWFASGVPHEQPEWFVPSLSCEVVSPESRQSGAELAIEQLCAELRELGFDV